MAHTIGLIGAGEIAQIHADLLTQDGRVQLTHVFDLQSGRAEATARRFGAQPAAGIEQVFEGCEAVYICTPNITHVEIALQAVEAGKHVFCEKPFAIGLADARRLRDAARKMGVLYQVGHNRRFSPVYQVLKKAIDEGRLAPHSVHARMNRGELQNPPWVWNSKLTGGFLYETPVHMFDLMRFFFGDVEWVQVAAHAREHEGELDDFSILLGFTSGLHATMTTYGHATWHFPFERFEVFGHHATYETFEMDKISFTHGLGTATTTLTYNQLGRNDCWGYREEDRLFVDALDGKGPVAVSAEDGYRAIELIEACYHSARSGERVQVARFDAEALGVRKG